MSGFTYEECVTLALRHDGQRVRFTYPNGHARVGVVSWRWRWPNDPDPRNEQIIYLDGRMALGELEGAIRFEVMQANGRYSEVA